MVKAKESSQTQARLKKLGNRYWRLNNLYWILDQDGNRIQFKMNAVQKILYFALWYLNIIPKSRQHGITTFICIFMLDVCLFNSNVRAGIIAHKLEDAKIFFRDKIKYAYKNLPEDLKASRHLLKDDEQHILFSNNSSIYVGTSMRSGTLQYLHVSEYGWLTIHAAQKAKEIKAGALETIHEGGMIFMESTAEGPIGDFKEMCDEAEKMRLTGKELGPMDWKIHFFAWMDKPSNQTDPRFVTIPKEMHEYFDKLEKVYLKPITLPQRAWYCAKKKTLKHLIYKEQPSTLEEAFIAAVEGAYYAAEMAEMREQGRICHVPHDSRYPVHTICDMGLGAHMPWIFFQVVGLEVHIIDCYCLDEKTDTKGGAVFFKGMLDEKRDQLKYNYGKHFVPFDANKGEIGTGQAIIDTFENHGISFEFLEVEHKVISGIERMTNMFDRLYIDRERGEKLIVAWSSYHREWIEKLDAYSGVPVDDKSSHFADAGRYLSKIVEDKLYKTGPIIDYVALSKRYNQQIL